jgi:3-oxoacyl-[acyl-carrier protein] reductase
VNQKVSARDDITNLFSLEGKTALITGAASGIGRATAAMMAAAGADIVCGWYAGDPYDVEETAAAIRSVGGRSTTYECDLTSPTAAASIVHAALEEFGRLDVVVANAGIARISDFTKLEDQQWQRVLDLNLGATFRLFRAALPNMLERGNGRLLATSSTSGAAQGWIQHADYCASKAGIVGLVKSLALDVGARGVTVNCVAPGVIVTPQSSDPVNSLGPTGLESCTATIPLGRTGQASEIAAAFLFLASEAASYITGQTLTVDGGAMMNDGTVTIA